MNKKNDPPVMGIMSRTPIGELTTEQLEEEVSRRKAQEELARKLEASREIKVNRLRVLITNRVQDALNVLRYKHGQLASFDGDKLKEAEDSSKKKLDEALDKLFEDED